MRKILFSVPVCHRKAKVRKRTSILRAHFRMGEDFFGALLLLPTLLRVEQSLKSTFLLTSETPMMLGSVEVI